MIFLTGSNKSVNWYRRNSPLPTIRFSRFCTQFVKCQDQFWFSNYRICLLWGPAAPFGFSMGRPVDPVCPIHVCKAFWRYCGRQFSWWPLGGLTLDHNHRSDIALYEIDFLLTLPLRRKRHPDLDGPSSQLCWNRWCRIYLKAKMN